MKSSAMTPEKTRACIDWLTMPDDVAYREKRTHKRYTRQQIADHMVISVGHLNNALSGGQSLSGSTQKLLLMLVED